MKRVLLLTAFILASFGISQVAKAGLLIEPLVGWSLNQNLSFDEGKDYSSGNGVSYGGRLGYQRLGAQIGIDFLQSDIEMGSSDFDKNVDTTEWAAFIGYKFPALFRIYGGYIFDAQADTELNNADVKMEDGKGFKAGLGFTILPLIDLNLEYRYGSYDTTKIGNVNFNGNDFEALMFSISAPFTLFDK